MKHRLKQPGHHDDTDGTGLNGSERAGEEEFFFVRGEAKEREEEGATAAAVGGASVTAAEGTSGVKVTIV